MNTLTYRQSPLRDLLPGEFKQLFDSVWDRREADDSAVVTAQWVPRVDIKEEANRFVIYADLPGIDPAQIEVQMDKGILSIKGERTLPAQQEGERGNPRR